MSLPTAVGEAEEVICGSLNPAPAQWPLRKRQFYYV